MRTVPSLHIPITPSRIARRGQLGLMLAALPLAWLSALPAAAQYLISALLLAALLHRLTRQAPARWSALVLSQQGVILHSDTAECQAKLEAGSHVHAWLIVLRLRDSETHKLRYLALWPDSAPADLQRQLRIWLLWPPPSPRETDEFL